MTPYLRRVRLLVLCAAGAVGCAGGSRSSSAGRPEEPQGDGATKGFDGPASQAVGRDATDQLPEEGNASPADAFDAETGGETSDAAPTTSDALDGAAGGGDRCSGVFCEDFEDGLIDSTKWNLQLTGGATAVIQQKTVAHGKYAAQFHGLGPPAGNAATAYAYLITRTAPAALLVHNFGRAYLYVSPKPHSNDTGLVFGGTTGFPKPTYLSLASHGSAWQFGFIKLQGSPGGERQSYSQDLLPVMTWMCLEWEFDDQPDAINVWRDGKAIGSLDPDHVDYPPGHVPGTPIFNGMSSGLVGGFTDFGFGFYDWHPGSAPFDVYYDDIVLDTKRVGCL